MNFFWVNIGSSYKEIEEKGFLWAPQYGINQQGKRFTKVFWDTVKTVKKGDIIFCNKDRTLIYIAIAEKDAEPAPRPETRTFQHWEIEGTKVPVKVIKLVNKIDISDFSSTFIALHNDQCEPAVFTKVGYCNQIYMSRIPKLAAKLITNFINDDISIDFESESLSVDRPKGGAREAIIQARVGHGLYRKKLMLLWKGKCAVTGVDVEPVLIASHIQGWTVSSDEEKVDPFNGFPLVPNLDKLFDKGMISFSDAGKLLCKPENVNLLHALNIPPNSKLRMVHKQNIKYLSKHRETHGF